jgi:hypothetical protein
MNRLAALLVIILCVSVTYAAETRFNPATRLPDIVDTVTPAHLFMGFADSTRTIDCTLNTWSQITNASKNLFTLNDSVRVGYIPGDTLIVHQEGDYYLNANLSFSGNNGETWDIGFIRCSTGLPIDYPAMRYTSNNDTGNASVQAYERLVPGEKIVLGIKNLTDSDDATVRSSTCTILLIHY